METSARSSPEPATRDAWLLETLGAFATPAQLAALVETGDSSLWTSATQRGLASDEQILAALAVRFRFPIADVNAASPRVREVVPEQLARRYRVLPIAVSASVVDVATADPHDLDTERALAFALGRRVRMSLASPTRIRQRLDELYRPEAVIQGILADVAEQYEVTSVNEDADAGEPDGDAHRAGERPVIQLADRIIAEAIRARASDIHLEPEEGGIAVRHRVDGVLREALRLPRAAGLPLVSRMKIMARLDIADRLRPQDGRARVIAGGSPVDLRVSTLPAAHGEKVVIRVLDQRATVLSLDALGLDPDDLSRIDRLLQAREGIILVTGPTGSGKTTTLYSMLRAIQARGVNIVTVEDPVEYRLGGIVQVQVHEKAGLTFPAALRSILRQDPDVILVGEVRDKDTAAIAVQASLTGHLVLTTLHTIDAAGAIARLQDIGVESYKLAASIKGVVAQRLVRRLCTQCRVPSVRPAPPLVQPWLADAPILYGAAGCDACAGSGYRGRLAITEVLAISPAVERHVAAGAPAARIADAARAEGMRGLWESGVRHVLAGATSLEEVLRTIEVPQRPPAGRGVLLVDDEAVSRGQLRALLEAEGLTVFDASDATAAVDEAERSAPGVVVLRIHRQRPDRLGALVHLRAARATAELPVIVLMSDRDEESEVRVFHCGATDCVSVPVRPRALAARIRALAFHPARGDILALAR